MFHLAPLANEASKEWPGDKGTHAFLRRTGNQIGFQEGILSTRAIKVRAQPTWGPLLMNRTDVHHVFPRNYLKGQGLSRGRYNQIANYVLAQSEINIAIGDKPPEKYFGELADQCAGGKKKYGGITSRAHLGTNLEMHCLPGSLLDGKIPAYDAFLRRPPKANGAQD
jgi:hypothetical protein